MLNASGQPIFVDKSGFELSVKLDKNGAPMVDDKGDPLYLDEKGNVIKATVDSSGKMSIEKNPIDIPGFMPFLD